MPERRPRVARASAATRTRNPPIASRETSRTRGSTPPSRANGNTMNETQSSNLVRGTRFMGNGPSSWHGDLLQDPLNHFRNRQPFDLELRPQDESMFQHRHGHCFDVVGSDEIAAREGGVGARSHEQ